MSFWKDNKQEPKRLFRFKVQLGDDGPLWWAKNVKIPTFTSTPVEHQYLDNVYKFPGKVRWQDITLTLVDPASPDAASQVMRLLRDSGYAVKDAPGEAPTYKTINKVDATETSIKDLIISVIDADGNPIEVWTVKHPMIVDADLSTFSYDSDDLREITMTIAYDYAECEIKTGNRSVDPAKYFQ